MATYQTAYASALIRDASGNFIVMETSASVSTATEAVDDSTFNYQEQITIDTDINTEQIEAVIEAFYQDGYIIYADGGHVLFTNTEYEPGFTFKADLDENGQPPALPVCFTAGTLIDTPNGPVAIESLQVGDMVWGSTGYRPVKWIGWRQYLLCSPRYSEAYRDGIVPVRIRAHALADNVPSRDIVLSPWHHLYIDDVLVKANQLVNGRTIVRESTLTRVTYFHIELDQFDVVRAHNVYSESWADGGNRDFFENVDVATLRPADQTRRRAQRPGFTVLSTGDALLADIRQRVAMRAEHSDDNAECTLAA
ncbi:Hint domain-containing protein [Bordetella genomosp. 4]|uniref:Hedgehog/Intein (Hint) domain-containing protein n=1 Tax=Bordetella genomosp. 4 TaxID=463044 RepID=A0A261UB59_9BORD|nr:Hint domain-containing protein [Bordetella genomosp. 4]OZI52705.1 hypothetical protein CAL21_03535 [Bordetella genomosp. 4]OZI59156.1 hypothetical protein CAL20_05905 [Bordetella genomosp. 4]